MAEGDKRTKKNNHDDEWINGNEDGRVRRSPREDERNRSNWNRRHERRFGNKRGSRKSSSGGSSRSRFTSSSRTTTSSGGYSRARNVRNGGKDDGGSGHRRPSRTRSAGGSGHVRRKNGQHGRQSGSSSSSSLTSPRTEFKSSPARNRDLPKTPEKIVERMGRTKKRILIELYKDSVGYKKLSKILGVGLDTIRSHIKSGKYSTSLQEIGLVERSENGGWQLTALGLQVCELLQQDPELRAYFY